MSFKWVKNFWNLIRYGGLEKEEYKSIRRELAEENYRLLLLYSILASVAFSLISISVWGASNFALDNRVVYISCLVISATIYVLTRFVLNQFLSYTKYVVFLFTAMLYGFSLALVPLHKEIPSVTMHVILVVIPLLFSVCPVVYIVSTLIVDLVFCLMCYAYKTPDMAYMDMWNAMSFSFVSMSVGTFVSRLRIQSILKNVKIVSLSEHDLLTGMRNRNSFEQSLQEYVVCAEKNIACIFGDVNGLHELNNSKGHKAGDIMLQSVALQFQQQFGIENSYRIGGDEYVSIMLDTTKEEMEMRIREIETACSDMGYHVSIGGAIVKVEKADMDKLVQIAETRMYEKKRAYYRENGIERRKTWK